MMEADFESMGSERIKNVYITTYSLSLRPSESLDLLITEARSLSTAFCRHLLTVISHRSMC